LASADRWRTIGVAALNPGVLINLLAGQTGFLSGGLMLGGARLMARHPLVSGALFGLLTYKPQLGIMIPIALVAARPWACIASATLVTALLATTTSLCFGFEAWIACWYSLGEYIRGYDAIHTNTVSPTILAMLQSMGIGHGFAAV